MAFTSNCFLDNNDDLHKNQIVQLPINSGFRKFLVGGHLLVLHEIPSVKNGELEMVLGLFQNLSTEKHDMNPNSLIRG